MKNQITYNTKGQTQLDPLNTLPCMPHQHRCLFIPQLFVKEQIRN
jgi:hypothetical protein